MPNFKKMFQSKSDDSENNNTCITVLKHLPIALIISSMNGG